ncbi:MAG: Xaa-Pro peptidase family protein [Fimbriimonadales bacterium]
MSLNQSRVSRLQSILADAGIDAYLACTSVSMGYLTEFFETPHERLTLIAFRPDGQPAMIAPSLSETHARHAGIDDLRIWKDGDDPQSVFATLAEDWRLKTAVIGVDDETPASFLLSMQAALPAALFKPAGAQVAQLRKVKDAGELDAMRKAGKIADMAFAEVLGVSCAARTEMDIANTLFKSMQQRGGTPTFCIVGTGANGAEPHHVTSSAKISAGDVVVMDWGCEFNRYQSDMTRTIACGNADEEAHKVYRVVHKAHMAARATIRPGVPAEDIDLAARGVIEEAGYGEYFIHRTGHGIGMAGHEQPNIVEGNTEPVVAGQCFSIEPGIYLPGKFGVRIENIVAVTEDGHESFNEEPSEELIEISS